MMDSPTVESPWKVLGARPLAVCRFAVSLLLVVGLIGSYRYYTWMTGHSVSRPTTGDPSRFATPQDTADRLVHAVDARRWRDEYECYTGAQQARFTYHVMVSTHDLSDSQDLAAELAHILQKFQLPLDLLDRFPSQRSVHIQLGNSMDFPLDIREHRDNYESQLERWQQEIQPLSIDWARLIEELQPLFVEHYRRHLHDSFLSESGIVGHLDFHVFKRVSDIKVNGPRAEGTIIAIVRNPMYFEIDDFEEERNGMAIPNMLYRAFEIITFRDRRVKRSPERIEFIKEGDSWKVSSIPFR